KRYGKKLTLFGCIDVQHLMPRGTPAEVRRCVETLTENCGPNEGLILAPAHHIQADTPLENILAFYEAGRGVEVRTA
ncbi:MAG: hypothetical protein KC940_03450, partial [Candidatus Omnitrophica bacterium]|nr:hypothetical protein [Candidatus Omnitrophota bacterium]